MDAMRDALGTLVGRLALSGLLLLSFACSAGGADAPPEVQARRIEGQVWSPYCPGRLLADCTTRQAHELRDEIEARLQQGEDPDEVLTWLEENYGEEVLARPRNDPTGWALWLVPAGLLVAGGAVTAWLIRRWRGGGGSAEPPPAGEDAPSDPWVARARDEARRDL